jgi:hypothetical protein
LTKIRQERRYVIVKLQYREAGSDSNVKYRVPVLEFLTKFSSTRKFEYLVRVSEYLYLLYFHRQKTKKSHKFIKNFGEAFFVMLFCIFNSMLIGDFFQFRVPGYPDTRG